MAYQDPCNLIVNYIPNELGDDELTELFKQYGPIASARVIVNVHTRESKGYGFVKFMDVRSAQRAIQCMNGFAIYGKRLKVTIARGPDQTAPPPYVPVANWSIQQPVSPTRLIYCVQPFC